ncbi:nucleoside phosphorylase domain-containing protein [Lasiosphaeria miniovina]|uniref:Nucleoside phosphorylase domain-containing protein n=1 Tax=Lasiosphaeria miniovina TaxID=1954250 RepID=A0AA40DKT6_9PEZI|nr:nucleoside phosphorylase domain-containing protein [Lasiosphaeria miniovina]KAK0706880.1 nucleoside phosphorylase domain-containing protein [Lasiosphaeria miniovina]
MPHSLATLSISCADTIGWICALAIEYVAARQVLDVEHDRSGYVSQPGDSNSYTFGSIASHNVVIAVLPSGKYGLTSAAVVARDIFRSFLHLRVVLMVGIGGGAPTAMHDICLGDVVISAPSSGRGGVYQYDFGKAMQGRGFQSTGSLNRPPTFVLTTVAELAARLEEDDLDLDADVDILLSRRPNLKQNYARPDQSSDVLYSDTYAHPNPDTDCSEACLAHETAIVPRNVRRAGHLKLVVIKDSTMRTKIANEADIMCFDMEAAGLMDQIPSFIIRGICDYADSHKNKRWQGYAAMTAATYAHRLLLTLPSVASEQELASFDLPGQDESRHVLHSSAWVVSVKVKSYGHSSTPRWL